MRIEYTRKAQTDLDEIYRYIAFTLSEPDTAAGIYGAITATIRSLETFPLRNPLVEDEHWKALGLRKMLVKNYLVFYTADDTAVKIIRIMYGVRDVNHLLSENKEGNDVAL